MNLLHDGIHAAADWLIGQVRSTGTEVSLFVGSHGGLVAVDATRAKRRAGFTWGGDYGPGLKYLEAVDDLTHLANELQQARAA